MGERPTIAAWTATATASGENQDASDALEDACSGRHGRTIAHFHCSASRELAPVLRSVVLVFTQRRGDASALVHLEVLEERGLPSPIPEHAHNETIRFVCGQLSPHHLPVGMGCHEGGASDLFSFGIEAKSSKESLPSCDLEHGGSSMLRAVEPPRLFAIFCA